MNRPTVRLTVMLDWGLWLRDDEYGVDRPLRWLPIHYL